MKKTSLFILVGAGLICAMTFLSGCSDMVLFHPKGPVGDDERFLMLMSIGLMLIVVLPAIVMALWFSRRYRASNTKAVYTPKWGGSDKIDLVIWLVPVAIVIALSYLVWTGTFRLDPYKPIDRGVKPIHIEVVSMDWKWLFIYPDHDIAAVNQLVFPAGVPLSFKLTSDTVMTSFFIPQLGSQMYAMAGMQTRLHLLADVPGVYVGQNQEFSGRGYSGMHFKAIATSPEEFRAWVAAAKGSPEKLDLPRYGKLRKPTEGVPVTYFSSVRPGLFKHIMGRYMGWMGKKGEMGKTGKTPAPVKKPLERIGAMPRHLEEG
ncbi:ubiquinol oxidase, subunit II [delta proteobacterium NaphS2]|nr:ubiquinol oxidase, subunit II [delta proteobacterium NaphS2]